LGFRNWKDEDIDLAINLWGNPDVTKLIDARGKLTRVELNELLTKEIETQKSFNVQYWPIFLLNTNEHIGCCGLRPYKPEKEIYEIEYAFKVLNCSALFAGHNPKNNVSKKLLEKLNFNYIRDEFYAPTALNHPSYLLTKEDYVTWKQEH
jgi:RimJ/RimL family protein N-acetyltransferase